MSYNRPWTAGHYMERVAVAVLEFAYTLIVVSMLRCSRGGGKGILAVIRKCTLLS